MDRLREPADSSRTTNLHRAEAALRGVRRERSLPQRRDWCGAAALGGAEEERRRGRRRHTYGKSTVPSFVQGPQRAIRQAAFADPFAKPHFAIASRPYAEQEGLKRHFTNGRSRGDR